MAPTWAARVRIRPSSSAGQMDEIRQASRQFGLPASLSFPSRALRLADGSDRHDGPTERNSFSKSNYTAMQVALFTKVEALVMLMRTRV